jgi:hypothetical protein
MRTKYSFLILFCIIGYSASGQSNKVIHNSSDIMKSSPDSIINITPSVFIFGKYLTVKYANGTEKKVSKDSIWGYQSKDILYRLVDKRFYQVVGKNETYIKYKHSTKFTQYYMSKNYDSEVLPFSKKNIARLSKD